MANFTFEFPDEFLKQLTKLGNDDGLYERMLKEASPIMETAMCKSLVGHYISGELMESIKARKPQKNSRGWYVIVGPTGYSSDKTYFAVNRRGKHTTRKYKLSNAAKAVWLEYGTSEEPAQPFLDNARKNANDEVIEKMQEVFNEGVNL